MPDAAPVAHTWCSQCGYCLDGLPETSRVCPECGGELERVEIVISHRLLKRKRGVWLAKAILASALVSLAFLVLVAPWRVFPRGGVHLQSPIGLEDDPSGPGSVNEWSIYDRHEAYSIGVGGPVVWDCLTRLDIALRLNSGSYVYVFLNPSTRTYSIAPGNTWRGPLDAEAIRAVAASAGVKTDRASFQDESRFVLSCIDAIIANRSFDPKSGPFEGGQIRHSGGVFIGFACWQGLLSTLVVFILISIVLCRWGWRGLNVRYRIARSFK